MARITVEDCLRRGGSRFELVHLAAQRVRQIREGSEYLVSSPKNEDIVVALREIAAGKITAENMAEAMKAGFFKAPAADELDREIVEEMAGNMADGADFADEELEIRDGDSEDEEYYDDEEDEA